GREAVALELEAAADRVRPLGGVDRCEEREEREREQRGFHGAPILDVRYGCASMVSLPDRPIHATTSLCRECRNAVPARVVASGSEVWMRKECPAHGAQDVRLSRDAGWY